MASLGADIQHLKSGMRCAKSMLLMVSLMFAITAVLLIMVGSGIQAMFGKYSQFVDSQFSSPPALLIAIGFIMLFVTALGAYGALKESVMLINLYGVFLFLVFILEMSTAIASFAIKGDVANMLQRTMKESLANYESNPFIKKGVDMMQYNLQCCGVESPADWATYLDPNQNLTANNNLNITKVPESCCAFWRPGGRKCARVYTDGCLVRLWYVIAQNNMLIATGATTVALVQLLGVICAFMLAKELRRNKSLREVRRWQMQQNLGILISGGKVMPPINTHMSGYTQMEKSEHTTEKDPITYTATSPSVN